MRKRLYCDNDREISLTPSVTGDLHVGGEDGGVVPGHLVPAQVIRQDHDDVRRTLGQH